MKPVIARNLVIGEGAPKTIVSLMDATVDQAIQTGKLAIASGADCLEWRADFCANVTDIAAMEADAQALRSALPDTPLLFTFRSADQGGQMELPFDQYFDLTEAMINTGAFDLVDVESRTCDERVSALTDLARKKNVASVVSHHDFEKTPSKGWMVGEMQHMLEMGADIPKIAVMAISAADTLDLLSATEEMQRLHGDAPLITMAMGRWGALSRLTGEVFGSAMTFCALKAASAPGQVDLALARSIMSGIHHIHSNQS